MGLFKWVPRNTGVVNAGSHNTGSFNAGQATGGLTRAVSTRVGWNTGDIKHRGQLRRRQHRRFHLR